MHISLSAFKGKYFKNKPLKTLAGYWKIADICISIAG